MAKPEAKCNLWLLLKMMTLARLSQRLHALSSRERALLSQRFFQNGPGEYGAGDQFLGLKVPQVRAILPDTDLLRDAEGITLLRSPRHEERLLALLILVRRFEKSRKDEPAQARIVTSYLAKTAWINNWDLVDSSAPQVLGSWLLIHDRSILGKLADSKSLWEQRISILATQAFIRKGELEDTLRLCARFLQHPHDLMHKACGWMPRETGRRNESVLRGFLDAKHMPRTMLRYALEKLPDSDRRHYMGR
jgi:3-methyladenine DNA glycosylase AlkD